MLLSSLREEDVSLLARQGETALGLLEHRLGLPQTHVQVSSQQPHLRELPLDALGRDLHAVHVGVEPDLVPLQPLQHVLQAPRVVGAIGYLPADPSTVLLQLG